MVQIQGPCLDFIHEGPEQNRYFALITGFTPKEWRHCRGPGEVSRDRSLSAGHNVLWRLRISVKLQAGRT